MTGPRAADLLRHLAVTEAAPDEDLLARFAAGRDATAFAELVRRHGPVVLAACRRGTRNHHDAEDAFQAVFLILARRAGAVRQPELLGNWLYRVAVRVARDARRSAARRRVREVQGVDIPEPVAQTTPVLHDLGPVLDEELAALPALYRDAVVLCDLRGGSRADAAAALRIPLGTLASRLDAGRKKLAARLTRRGVALSVGAVLVEGRAVAVPDPLLTKTSALVADWAAGVAVPATVVRLARGGYTMRTVLLGGVLTLSLAAGAVVAVGRESPATPPEPPPAANAVAPDAPKGSDAPKGPDLRPADAPARVGPPRLARKQDLRLTDQLVAAWSPTGSWLAVSGRATAEPRPGAGGRETEWHELDLVPGADPAQGVVAVRLPDGGRFVAFAGDDTVLTQTTEPNLISGTDTLDVWAVGGPPPGEARPPAALRRTDKAFDLPRRATGFAVSGSLVRFVVPEYGRAAITRAEVRGLDARDGRPAGPAVGLTGAFQAVAPSPDGSRAAAMTTAGVVEGYGADGKRAWTAELPPAEPAVQNFGFGFGYLTYARGGAVLLAVRPWKRPAAFAAGTGEARPAFEDAERVDAVGWVAAVSADGRLAAVAYRPAGESPKDVSPLRPPGPRLTVWDTGTGRVVQTWPGVVSGLAFHPTRPVLAVLEAHRGGTRLGLWDFTAQP